MLFSAIPNTLTAVLKSGPIFFMNAEYFEAIGFNELLPAIPIVMK